MLVFLIKLNFGKDIKKDIFLIFIFGMGFCFFLFRYFVFIWCFVVLVFFFVFNLLWFLLFLDL